MLRSMRQIHAMQNTGVAEMYIEEVFASIQGESSYSGFPTVFCRMYGCNLNCNYCDQHQKKESRKKINADNLLSMINKFQLRHVCFTGGEPLLQVEIYELIYTLTASGIAVTIETNGSIPLSPDYYARSYKYIMDIKTPSSGMAEQNCYNNLELLHKNDEVKFVVADRADYEFAKKIINKHDLTCTRLFSPIFKGTRQTIGTDLARWMVEDRINGRLQLQIHKILGVK